MGIDDADGLQVGVDDGAAYELHSPARKVLGDGIGQGGSGLAGLMEDVPLCEAPDIPVKRTVFPTNLIEHAGIGDGSTNLQSVADNPLSCCNA